MSDARAPPAPLGHAVEESQPAADVAAALGSGVGHSYDEVSYTLLATHNRAAGIGLSLGRGSCVLLLPACLLSVRALARKS
jgi:hypothetical protein